MKFLQRLSVLLCIIPVLGLALGTGNIIVNSKLYQPLDAKIPLTGLNSNSGFALSEITVNIASQDQYNQLNLPIPALKGQFNFRIDNDAQGNPYIFVTTDAPIEDPDFELLIDINWPRGQLLQHYTLLLDPPDYDQSSVTTPATQNTASAPAVAASPVRNAATVTPAVAAPATQNAAAAMPSAAASATQNMASNAAPANASSAASNAAMLAAAQAAMSKNMSNAAPATAQSAAHPTGVNLSTVTPAGSSVQMMQLANPDNAENNVQVTAMKVENVAVLAARLAALTQSLQDAQKSNQLLQTQIQQLSKQNQQLQILLNQAAKNLKALQAKSPPQNTIQGLTNMNSTMTLWWILLLLFLIFIIAYIVVSRGKKSDLHPIAPEPNNTPETDTPAEVEHRSISLGDSVVVEEPKTTSETPETNTAVTHSPEEILEEVKAYMTYARFTQAETTLLAAVKVYPEEIKLWQQLLTFYLETNQRSGFTAIVSQIPDSLTAPDSDLRKQIERLSKDQTWGRNIPTEHAGASEVKLASFKSDEPSASGPRLSKAETTSGNTDWLDEQFTGTNKPTETPANNAVVMPELEMDIAATTETTDTTNQADDVDAFLSDFKSGNPNKKVDENIYVDDGIGGSTEISLSEPKPQQYKPKTGLPDEKEVDLSGEDSPASRLDLARAYIDMGDILGAKDVLQTVLKSGDEAQRTEARTLLAECEKLG